MLNHGVEKKNEQKASKKTHILRVSNNQPLRLLI